MAGLTLRARLEALVGNILVRHLSSDQGPDPVLTIWAAVRVDGEGRSARLLAWPVTMTHQGWSHPGFEDFQRKVHAKSFCSIVSRGPHEPSILPRAHLDYRVARGVDIALIETSGPRLVAKDILARLLVQYGVFPREALLDDIVDVVGTALRGPMPASTMSPEVTRLIVGVPKEN